MKVEGEGTTIVLDARSWRTGADVFAALLPALRTPEWAGGNLDALYDCLVAGHVGVASPVTVRVEHAADWNADLSGYAARVVQVFDDARRDYGVAASMTILA